MRDDFKLALSEMDCLVGKLRGKHNQLLTGPNKKAAPYAHLLLQIVPIKRAFLGMSQGSVVGQAVYTKRYKKICDAMIFRPHAIAWDKTPEGYSILSCRVPVPSHKPVAEWELISLQQLYTKVLAEDLARRSERSKKMRNHEDAIVEFVRSLSASQKSALTSIFKDARELGYGRLVLDSGIMHKAGS